MNFIKNIKTTIGLSAFSILVAYLLTDKLIDAKVINTDFTVLLILIFIFIFIVANFLFIMATTNKSSKQNVYNQGSMFSKDGKQTIKNNTEEEGSKFNQKDFGGKGNKQTIKTSSKK